MRFVFLMAASSSFRHVCDIDFRPKIEESLAGMPMGNEGRETKSDHSHYIIC